MKAIWIVPILASILILGSLGLSQDVFAPQPGLEIKPDSQEPGKKFRMNDPQGRFADGTTAIFRLEGEDKAVVPLKIVAQGKKAMGVTPDLPDDTYTVFANTPGGVFEVDTLIIATPPDTEPPIITASTDPLPNANGWNNSDVTVSFACVDNEGGSGVATLTPDIVILIEDANTGVVGTCTDVAGNSASVTVTVSLDKTAPALAISPTDGETVTTTTPELIADFSDLLAGIISFQASLDAVDISFQFSIGATQATVTSPALSEGPHTFSVTVTDRAGNASTVFAAFFVDTTP